MDIKTMEAQVAALEAEAKTAGERRSEAEREHRTKLKEANAIKAKLLEAYKAEAGKKGGKSA